MDDCVFCKINKGLIDAKKLYEDELMFIIQDISPRAKKHYLMIPKKHYKLLQDMSIEDGINLGKCLKKLPDILKELKLGLDNGFRLIINQGEDAVQTVFHLHVHIMGGERLPV